MDSRTCQTSAASPAEPGGLPFGLGERSALPWKSVGASAARPGLNAIQPYEPNAIPLLIEEGARGWRLPCRVR